MSADVSLVLLTGGGSRRLQARVVADAVDGAGPLAGVVAGLRAARTPLAVVVACDMPTLVPAVVEMLLDRLRADAGLLAACCEGPRGLAPLPLALRTSAQGPLGAALERGVRALRDALAGPGLIVVDEAGWRPLDPDGHCFVNWNRPEEIDCVVH
ncbi:MAG: hypothetical protein E6J03_06915 [Chloroflexi bacterium]|nr:MAG: hypothetical protein E6J03_06915 [Chloroflexota bacterium]